MANKNYNGCVIATGSGYPELSKEVADGLIAQTEWDDELKELGVELVSTERKAFMNTEKYVRYEDSIRKKDVFLVNTFPGAPEGYDDRGYNVDSLVMETFFLGDAAKRASANEVIAVLPNFPYARQDRKSRGREAISASVVTKILNMYYDRVIVVDLHSSQTQGVFNGPFDPLIAFDLLGNEVTQLAGDDRSGGVVIAGDAGGLRSAELHGEKLDMEVLAVPKKRDREDSSKISRQERVRGVKGKTCYIIDDMIDSAGTLVGAAETLERSGCNSVIALATHGLFSGPAFDRLINSPIEKIIVTDTVPQEIAREALGDRLKVVSIAPMLVEAIGRISTGRSISEMFNDLNNK